MPLHQGKEYRLDKKSTADGGLFGGGLTSFYDFSFGKNAISMFMVCLLLAWLFISIARHIKIILAEPLREFKI
jgi:F-type H+-transporting ATPase subunit a